LGLGYLLYRLIKGAIGQQGWVERLKWVGYQLMGFVAAFVFFFNLSWGCNYERLPFEQQIGIKIVKMDSIALVEELQLSAQDLVSAYDSLHKTNAIFEQENLVDSVRQIVSDYLISKRFCAGGRLRGRILTNGFLLRFGTSGVYMPWLGESNIDGGLHALQQPFTLAHEFAHGYGWTDEGTCNFIAYLACTRSQNLLIRYSAYMDYFRYVVSNYKYNHVEEYAAFRAKLPQGIRDDLDAINIAIKKYPTVVSFTDLYGYYLKSQGVKEGMRSYSRVIKLVHSMRRG
jgi:urease gamma subunit